MRPNPELPRGSECVHACALTFPRTRAVFVRNLIGPTHSTNRSAQFPHRLAGRRAGAEPGGRAGDAAPIRGRQSRRLHHHAGDAAATPSTEAVASRVRVVHRRRSGSVLNRSDCLQPNNQQQPHTFPTLRNRHQDTDSLVTGCDADSQNAKRRRMYDM